MDGKVFQLDISMLRTEATGTSEKRNVVLLCVKYQPRHTSQTVIDTSHNIRVQQCCPSIVNVMEYCTVH